MLLSQKTNPWLNWFNWVTEIISGRRSDQSETKATLQDLETADYTFHFYLWRQRDWISFWVLFFCFFSAHAGCAAVGRRRGSCEPASSVSLIRRLAGQRRARLTSILRRVCVVNASSRGSEGLVFIVGHETCVINLIWYRGLIGNVSEKKRPSEIYAYVFFIA